MFSNIHRNRMNVRCTQIAQIQLYSFPAPTKLGALFLNAIESILTQFISPAVPSHTFHKKNALWRVLGALKSILDRHLDLFVFPKAKVQGYNRAPLLDRINRYNQIAFFIQFRDTRFY